MQDGQDLSQGWVPPVPSSSPVGTVTADGRWRWDGVRWMPTGATGPVVGEGWAAPSAAWELRDATVHARLAVGALLAAGLAWVVVLIADNTRRDLASRVLSGNLPSLDQATASDNFVKLSGQLELGLTALTGLLFLMWLYRLVANNHALGGRPLRFTPGWAVGWWFIPVASVWRVPQVIAESRRATQPEGGTSWRLPTAVIAAWWTCYMVGGGLSAIGGALQPKDFGDSLQSAQDAFSTMRAATTLEMAGAAVTVLAAGLCMFIVWRLTMRQRVRIAARAQGASAAA